MIVTHNTIVNYFSNLVAQSTLIDSRNFFRFDISEIEGAMRTNITYPCFALESHEGNFSGSSHNNSLDNKVLAFSILGRPKQGDFTEQNNVLDQAETIGKKFISRLRLDSTDASNPMYKQIEVQNISYHKVGPIYIDMLYGYRFEITLKSNKLDLKVLPEDWEDINSVC